MGHMFNTCLRTCAGKPVYACMCEVAFEWYHILLYIMYIYASLSMLVLNTGLIVGIDMKKMVTKFYALQ